LATVEEQIAEMKEYFRAWQAQDTSIRDYKPYFKVNIVSLKQLLNQILNKE